MAGTKVRLIALDDELIDREITKIMCGMIGTECHATGSFNELMDTFQEYDGLILDYCLFGKYGTEVAEIIRSKISSYSIMFRSNFPEGSPAYESMIVYGPVIEKNMAHLALEELKDFVEQIRIIKDEQQT
jgi:hypothetical protein